MFFHSYGDLGMILRLVSKNAGLSLGSKGLNVCSPHSHWVDTYPTLTKSTSFPILHTRLLISAIHSTISPDFPVFLSAPKMMDSKQKKKFSIGLQLWDYLIQSIFEDDVAWGRWGGLEWGVTTKVGPIDTRRVDWALGTCFSSWFFIRVSFFYNYVFIYGPSLAPAMIKTGPNGASGVV